MKENHLMLLQQTIMLAEQGSEVYNAAAVELNRALRSTSTLDQLRQLVEKGPVWDGDVISKSSRDTLLTLGLAAKVCVRGKQGYNAATYRGWDVLKAVQ